MENIRKANVLKQEDLLLLENHSLDKTYELEIWTPDNLMWINCKNVTKLMLLIDFLHRYNKEDLNNVIKKYIEDVPDEIKHVDDLALEICIYRPYLETLKILLNGGITNYKDWLADSALRRDNFKVFKLLMEYDVCINIKAVFIPGRNKVDKIIESLALLNTKN